MKSKSIIVIFILSAFIINFSSCDDKEKKPEEPVEPEVEKMELSLLEPDLYLSHLKNKQSETDGEENDNQEKTIEELIQETQAIVNRFDPKGPIPPLPPCPPDTECNPVDIKWIFAEFGLKISGNFTDEDGNIVATIGLDSSDDVKVEGFSARPLKFADNSSMNITANITRIDSAGNSISYSEPLKIYK